MTRGILAALCAALAVLTCIPAVAEAVEVSATACVLMDADTGQVLYEKNGDKRMLIASTTKLMTALVALELGTPSQVITVTAAHMAEGSSMYLRPGEKLTLEELLYGLLLCSGNDAALALTECAGGVAPFVERMNEKAAALGLTSTHFMNTSGLHDENHYSTVREIALILQAALENETCAEILSAENYRASETEQHPDGLAMTNKFLYRVHHEYALNGAEITAAKTGYTAEAMNCCASAGKTPDGRSVICVTANAWTGDFCIEDHIALYTKYCGSTEAE